MSRFVRNGRGGAGKPGMPLNWWTLTVSGLPNEGTTQARRESKGGLDPWGVHWFHSGGTRANRNTGWSAGSPVGTF